MFLHKHFPLTLPIFGAVSSGVTGEMIEQLVTRHTEIISMLALPVRFGLSRSDTVSVWKIFCTLKQHNLSNF